jgi:hypothetical protein
LKKKRPSAKLPVAQFVAIIALSISLFLIVDLARRAAANYRVQREAYRLTQEVESMRDYQAKLLSRRTYVASDLYVEEVARKELKWARPGETVVVVMPTPQAFVADDQAQQRGETPALLPQTPRQAWQQLLFGRRMPSLTSAATP